MDDIIHPALSIEDDSSWLAMRDQWPIEPETTYLNHGSFGPTPLVVRECQQEWQRRLADQPMDFYVRKIEPAWKNARKRLADFVEADENDLVFAENSTAAMNVVANSVSLKPGDQVLLTDHEYGAVFRIWRRACQQTTGAEVTTAKLPSRFESPEQVGDSILAAATERTRMLIVSHVTSPTATILPVHAICEEARRRGISVCIDGPHAPAQVPLSINTLACDFYTASLHKWVSAPFGSGFLYVSKPHQEKIEPPLLSWGRLPPQTPDAWWEEFVWQGTRDPSAYLATGAAIDLMERQLGLSIFRARTHFLANYARHRIIELTGLEPQTPDSDQWYGSMVGLPLPPGNAADLQNALWQQYKIETPVIEHNGQRSIRVSCHVYNCHADIDLLVESLRTLLAAE